MIEKGLLRIAIDGPGGSGKSTIAKLLAKELNIDYVDTGAMYRAIGLKIKNENIDVFNKNILSNTLNNTTIDFKSGSIYLDGQNVDTLIRTPEISMVASEISAIDIVREKLVNIQRKMGQTKSMIMDGRDIGTNVLLDAEYKFFMNASIEERANRRFKELIEKGQEVDFNKVLEEIKLRDHNDMTRELNPLKKAEDAIELDTTSMTIEEVVTKIKGVIENGKS